MKASFLRGTRGMTLVELLVTLLVAAIFAALAVPAYERMVSTHRLALHANLLLTSLYLARTEAVKRNRRVVLCRSAGGETCAPEGGWHQGWIVFVDANNNGERDADELLLRREGGLPSGYFLTGNTPVSQYVSYTPTGMTKLVSGAFQAGTLTLCTPHASDGGGRQIVVSATGRPRISTATLVSCP